MRHLFVVAWAMMLVLGSILGAQEPDLDALIEQKEFHPKKVTLTQSVDFELRAGDRVVGRSTVEAGESVDVLKVSKEGITVKHSSGTQQVPFEKTDWQQKALEAWRQKNQAIQRRERLDAELEDLTAELNLDNTIAIGAIRPSSEISKEITPPSKPELRNGMKIVWGPDLVVAARQLLNNPPRMDRNQRVAWRLRADYVTRRFIIMELEDGDKTIPILAQIVPGLEPSGLVRLTELTSNVSYAKEGIAPPQNNKPTGKTPLEQGDLVNAEMYFVGIDNGGLHFHVVYYHNDGPVSTGR